MGGFDARHGPCCLVGASPRSLAASRAWQEEPMEYLAIFGVLGGGLGAALVLTRLGMGAVIALLPHRRSDA